MCQHREKYPRTLIVSANALSTQQNNGKMVASFFKDYPSQALAQVYIWPEYPNSSICSSYYRITDMEMLRSWFGKEPGQIVKSRLVQQDQRMPGIFKKNIKNSPTLRLARDIMWLRGSWKTDRFLQWADAFSPEIIFFLGTNSPALYHITDFLSARFGAPVIVYIADDYFLPRFSLSFPFHIRRKWLERSMRRLLQREKTALLTINRYMGETYQSFFGKSSQQVFHSVTVGPLAEEQKCSGRPLLVSYIGNLGNNRTSTLRRLCRILAAYPHHEDFRFQIFTQEAFSDREKAKWTLPPYMEHCGALNPEGVRIQLAKSDVLFHVESFHYQNRRDCLLSLSTKLMEYMAAGKPILMIAPPEIGSTHFLKETDNVVVDKLSRDGVYQALDRLLNTDLRRKISESNQQLAERMLGQSGNAHLVLDLSYELLEGH